MSEDLNTHTDLLDARRAAELLESLVEAQLAEAIASDGSVHTFVGVEGDLVDRFFAAHGESAGADVASQWSATADPPGPLAMLLLRLDADGTELRIRFPLPEALGYIERVATEGQIVIGDMRGGTLLGLDVAQDVRAVTTVAVVAIALRAVGM